MTGGKTGKTGTPTLPVADLERAKTEIGEIDPSESGGETGTPTFESRTPTFGTGTESGTPTLPVADQSGREPGMRAESGGESLPESESESGTPTFNARGRPPRHMSRTPSKTTPSRTPIVSTPPPGVVGEDLLLEGTAPGARRVQVVVDADLERAQTIAVDNDGRWRATVATDSMIDPALTHRLVVHDPDSGAVSAPLEFRVERRWRMVADVADPAGDDRGPTGRYVYPDDPVWRGQRPADLLGARVWTSGGALRLQLRMPGLSTVWKPTNGFDHVAFTVFVELPDRTGAAAAMPQQQAQLPDGMRWHLRLRAHGWSNALFDAEGADAEREGGIRPTAARIETDAQAGTVTFTLPAQALDGVPNGARLHITTWDYDGGYRPLAPEATGNTFGGGAADGPKVMDAMTFALPGGAP